MFAAIFLSGAAAQAAPFVRTITEYYDISGSTGRELKAQMKKKGPQGYWAYTRWHVRWSSNCLVEVKITYTYPRLKNPEKTPLPVRKRWQTMMEKLVLHEEGHAQHGLNAASEIREAKCKKAKKIIKKWAAQDKIYDKKTRHGINQGVKLSN